MAKFNKPSSGGKPAGKAQNKLESNGASDFLTAMNRYKTAYDEAKKTEATGGDFPDAQQLAEALGIDEGSSQRRVARVKEVRVGADKNKDPYVVFDFEITRGEGKGSVVSIFSSIKDGKKKGKDGKIRTAKDVLDRICQNFQRLDYETEDTTHKDLVGMAKAATAEHASVQLNIKYDGEYLNVFLNKKLEDVADDDDEDRDPPDNDEENGDDEGSDAEPSDDEDEETDGDMDDDAELEKGVEVLYQAKGSRKPEACEVLLVSKDKDTVNLLRLRDKKKFSAIPVDEVELVFAE